MSQDASHYNKRQCLLKQESGRWKERIKIHGPSTSRSALRVYNLDLRQPLKLPNQPLSVENVTAIHYSLSCRHLLVCSGLSLNVSLSPEAPTTLPFQSTEGKTVFRFVFCWRCFLTARELHCHCHQSILPKYHSRERPTTSVPTARLVSQFSVS